MLHTIKNDFLSVTVSEQGAQLQSILSGSGTEYLWQGDPKYWPDRALNLFPYVARLTEGAYFLDGEKHHMGIHGIAPYRRFSTTEHTGDRLVMELVSDAATLAEYPRQFSFRIVYVLREDTLEVTFQVENRDKKTMYFGLGGHPGFNVPVIPGKSFEDYRLRFGEACTPVRIGFSDDCFVTGDDTPFPLEDNTILPLRHSLFDKDAIVLKDMAHQVVLEASDGTPAVTVTFPGMPYLGLWHWPRTDAPYICIEPWCSLPSRKDRIAVLEEQEDLICLVPGETYRNTWTIRIHHR